MNGNREGQKMWPRRDFCWLAIVCLEFAVACISLVFWDHEKSIKALDVAGIVTSIVLAVIVIVYTFVDSGNQKAVVYELGTNVRNLEQSLAKLMEIIPKMIGGLEEVHKAADELENIAGVGARFLPAYLSGQIGAFSPGGEL